MSLPSESNRDLRLALLAGYLLLLVVMIAGSEIRRVGDGREYLDMATALVHFEAPRCTRTSGCTPPSPHRFLRLSSKLLSMPTPRSYL